MGTVVRACDGASRRRLLVLEALLAASAAVTVGVTARVVYLESLETTNLVWNLFLAWIPLLLALFVYDRYRRGTPIARLVPPLVLWLLFLPNAPYIVTDFVHLSATRVPPLWFDGVELSAFAWTGMLLGFVSLYLVHAVLRHRFGAPAGWLVVLFVLALASAGVYLGRVKRWNSWDLLTQPGQRLAELHAHVGDPAGLAKAIAVSAGVTSLLAASYLVFYLLMGARIRPDLD